MGALRLLALAGVSLLSLSTSAYAQTEAPADDGRSDPPDRDIVVTGTLMRGVAPAGQSTVAVSQQDVQASGATNAAQILQTIPQISSFGKFLQPAGAFNSTTSNRPNLRDLPLLGGNSPTLVLVDGHRLVGMGIQSTSPDPDIVPPGLVERVEVVPDGGSAIYGSDAVAGVINFITRRRFDGVEVDARYGWGDEYHTFDAYGTIGKDWGSGSAFVSYNYSEHDAIYGRDRGYSRFFAGNEAPIPFPVTSLLCPGGTGLIAGAFTPVKLDSVTVGSYTECDPTDSGTIYPSERRHSVMAGLTQELGEGITLDARGFYTHRKTYASQGYFNNQGPLLVGPSFIPGFTPSPFNPLGPDTPLLVYTAWGDPEGIHQNLTLKTWGISPTITADLDDNWQLRSLTSFSASRTEQQTIQPNFSAILPAIAAGLFNPFDPDASSAVGLDAVGNYSLYGLVRQRQFNQRFVIDGDLLPLPGGAVKLAVGLEYIHESFDAQNGLVRPGTENTGYGGLVVGGATIIPAYDPLPRNKLKRDVLSAFGEVVVPIFGADNGGPGMEELVVSLAGRYDDYSDVGDTFNPKIGVTYRPVQAIKIRGSWGKSFVAPSLADSPLSVPTSFAWVPLFSAITPPDDLIANGTYPALGSRTSAAVVLGNAPDIQPQTATNWSVGADLEPPFIPGLTLGATYWNLDYKNVITLPQFTNRELFWRFFGSYIYEPDTYSQYLGIANQVQGTPCGAAPETCLYKVLDARNRNLGRLKMSGIDFYANYVLPTGFGSIDLALNGSYDLKRRQQAITGATYADVLDGFRSPYRLRTALGGQFGNLRAQATWNHIHGYDLAAPVGLVPQTRVGSFNVVDLFFKYDVEAEGLLGGLSFTLNVSNLFDQDPPEFREQNQFTPMVNGYANGATVGRLVQLGVHKRF